MNAPAAAHRGARLWRVTAAVLAGVLIAAALLLGALRLLVARVPEDAARIQAWVERQTGLRVEYGQLDARLRWFGPEIVLRDVRVLDRDRTQALFETREGSVGLDVWNLFRTGELVAGRIRFVGPEITVVRLQDGRIRLLGQNERPSDRPPLDLDRLPAGRVEVQDATVVYRDLMKGTPALRLAQLRFSLQRAHDHVAVTGSARLPEALGAAIEFNGKLSGSLERYSELDAELQVSADRVQLPGLAPYLTPHIAQPLDGSGSVTAQLGIAKGRLELARLDVDLADVRLRLPTRDLPAVETLVLSEPHARTDAAPTSLPIVDTAVEQRPASGVMAEVSYPSLAGSFRLRREGEIWNFRAQRLRLSRGGGQDREPAAINGTWRGNVVSRYELSIAAQGVRLDDLWPLALAVAPAGFDRFAALNPTGEIHSLRVDAVRERAGAWPRFALSADLADVSVTASGHWPGVQGVTGVVSGTDRTGTLALRSKDFVFDLPNMFRAPIGAMQVEADAGWQREGDRWSFTATRLAFQHPRARGTGTLELAYDRPGGSPRLRMDIDVDGADVAFAGQVLPYGRFGPGAVSWLAPAFLRGHVDAGHVHFAGPAHAFPFRYGEGEFVATANVSGVGLNYFTGFAPLANGAGSVEFRNAGMKASLKSGDVGGLRLTRAEVTIPDMGHTVVEVDATADGDLGGAFSFVQGSPLGPLLGAQFMSLAGAGPADYAVRLHLPTGPIEPHDYVVQANLHSATVTLPALRAPIQRVSGLFELHNLEARASSLHGVMLDGPFELRVEPGEPNGDVNASVLLHGRGKVAGSPLPAFVGLPSAVHMDGATEWKLEGRMERRASSGHWSQTYRIDSDLAGLRIDAPRPFAKPAGDARPTEVTLDLRPDGSDAVAIDLGSARARLLFAEGEDGHWALERGAARFDGRIPVLPGRPGFRLSGDWPEFDLGEWLALGSGPQAGARLSDWLGPTDVHLDSARLFGFEFTDVDAALQPQPDADQLTLGGPMAEGRVLIPADLGSGRPIQLELSHLHLQPATGGGKTGDSTIDPRKIPAIQLRAADFAWQERRFGSLSVDLEKDPRGLRLARLEAKSADFTIDGYGSWLVEADGPRTTLNLEMSSTDLGAASRELGIPGSLEAEETHATASLSWSGGPSTDVLGRMHGTLSIELARGQVRSLKPGAGRMLGLTSLAELPRRLTLDFHDVTDTGLAFDTVHGDFDIHDGNVYTKNLLLKGAAVDIGIVGRTGLVAQDYDQTVVVSGNPSGPITVAGALAAGPIGAAGGLLLSQIFKGQLQGLARIYYRVTGPWATPVVERVSGQAVDNLAAEPASSNGGGR